MCRKSTWEIEWLTAGWQNPKDYVYHRPSRADALLHYAEEARRACISGGDPTGHGFSFRSNGSVAFRVSPVATRGCDAQDVFGSIEIANRGADAFLRLYYRAYDGATRAVDLPKMYRATSKAMWNGTALDGADAVRDFVAKLPKVRGSWEKNVLRLRPTRQTHHEVQSYDCHPVPGARVFDPGAGRAFNAEQGRHRPRCSSRSLGR